MAEPLKALVVDDEHDVKFLFTQRFRREVRKGLVELQFAHSGPEALQHLREGGLDVVLVLSDINMPGMTGIELLRAITAYDDAALQEEAFSHGAEGYLTKPLDFSELKREVFQIEV